LIDEHAPRAKRAIWLWDSWFTCADTALECVSHGYNWVGEIKSNREVFYEGKEYHLNKLVDKLRCEGQFFDVMVHGEFYQASNADVFIPKIGDVSIVVNVKATTKDAHLLCTDLMGCSFEEVVGHALERHRIDDFYKEAKALGFREYKFRESEAALIHAHLVALVHTLLDVLRRRLLRYSIVKCLPSIAAAVEC